MGLLALRGVELFVIDRMVVLIKPEHHRALISRVVRHEQVTAIPDEHPLRIKEPVGLEDFLDRSVEPLLPLGRGHILHELAQGVLVTGGLPIIGVLLIETDAVQEHRAALGIQMFGGQGRIQRA